MNLDSAPVQNRSTKGDDITQEVPMACANERAAVEFLERLRWGVHPACPRCGDMNVYQMQDSRTGDREKNHRWNCRGCRKQFTVRIGTVFEDSRIPARHWCYAYWRACTSKKGVSALEIHRQTGVSYKSALFMLHRIRYSLLDSKQYPLQGVVEVDETYIGGKPRYVNRGKRGRGTKKTPVVALVSRNGQVRTQPVADVTAKTLKRLVRAYVGRNARIITDENPSYNGLEKQFKGGHDTVKHKVREYVRGDIYSNTAESFFAVVKRGLNGIYHAVSKEHLGLYMNEYAFRWNNRKLEDGERIQAAIQAAEGKRLLYREPIGEAV